MKEVRPTSGKVLQALFNVLGPLEEKGFLDLFAGTGQVAREAAERGARPVVAVELVRGRCERLRPLEGESVSILFMDARRGIRFVSKRFKSFDVIFADPPYGEGWNATLGELVRCGSMPLACGGVLVIEASAREPFPELAPEWNVERRDYGETVLFFCRKIGSNGRDNP